MKFNKQVIPGILLLIALSSLYRIIPGRPLGFAPQLAIAIFCGSVFREKKYAFLVPLFSMLVSDVIFEVLNRMGLTTISGFYGMGQVVNYLFILAVTMIGFFISRRNVLAVLAGSVGAAFFFYFASNTAVWIGGGLDINNQPYPLTIQGLTNSLVAGLPFLRGSLQSTLLFSGILFGGYELFTRFVRPTAIA